MVSAVSDDHAQLRALIYEHARIKLRKDLYGFLDELGWTGIAERVLALEAAIDRVEADFASASALPARPLDNIALADSARDFPPASGTRDRTALIVPPASEQLQSNPRSEQNAVVPEVILPDDDPPILPSFLRGVPDKRALYRTQTGGTDVDTHLTIKLDNRQSGWWWTAQLILAATLGVAIYAAILAHQLRSTGPARDLAGVPPRSDESRLVRDDSASDHRAGTATSQLSVVKSPTVPVPSRYGAFAINNGALVELDLLPIRVPDSRVAISALIPTPSRAHLSDGHLQFIVFRRDLATDAPDHVALRVVAQVVRALTFDAAGHPKVTSVENAWAVRSNSYEMTVGPVADKPDMILIRPDDPKMVFPAGRYALALKGAAYDLTIDGPLSDPVHCLERTDAVNFPVYTECRNP